MEKVEFTFPDESENPRKGGAVVEQEVEVEAAAEPEVEVIDDTPEQDRGPHAQTGPRIDKRETAAVGGDEDLPTVDALRRSRLQAFCLNIYMCDLRFAWAFLVQARLAYAAQH